MSGEISFRMLIERTHRPTVARVAARLSNALALVLFLLGQVAGAGCQMPDGVMPPVRGTPHTPSAHGEHHASKHSSVPDGSGSGSGESRGPLSSCPVASLCTLAMMPDERVVAPSPTRIDGVAPRQRVSSPASFHRAPDLPPPRA